VHSPRPLTSREREVLALLLPAEGFRDVEVYRAQLDRTSVTGRCDCGCATIYLGVDPAALRASAGGPADSLLPFEARGQDPADRSLPIEIILFGRDGALASLEIVYYGDTPPPEFPDPTGLELRKER
jgi:hypothetical protein